MKNRRGASVRAVDSLKLYSPLSPLSRGRHPSLAPPPVHPFTNSIHCAAFFLPLPGSRVTTSLPGDLAAFALYYFAINTHTVTA